MSLAAGSRLGPYEILSPLGAGGMGEVYKARDTRLDRTVALKVLPADIAGDPQARDRLEREARAVGALNHPHICTLHDIGRHEVSPGSGQTVDYLVMEYVEGETLAARLEKGPLPLDQALACAIQIASALDRAHRAGIVHRDIKPGNIMLTKGGSKLLDFGIAKAPAPAAPRDETTQHAPKPLTERGLIVGTVQYMAPEQIEGGPIDARTDLFAFGAVLYEMVTGRKAFEGGSQASVMAAILERNPPRLSSVHPLAPAVLDRIVSTCLEKDADRRWQTAHDVRLQLEHLATDKLAPATVVTMPVGQIFRQRLAWSMAAAGIAASLTLAVLHFGGAPTAQPPIRFMVPPPQGEAFAGPVATVPATQLALSPDGRRLVFVASSTDSTALLWIRDMDAPLPRPLSGTDDASYPFWSPDSQTVGFFANGRLKRVDLLGGAPQILCDAPEPRGGTWNRDGVIVFAFSNNAPLNRISASGGTPTAVTVLSSSRGEVSHRWPEFLPDGRQLLYRTRSTQREHDGIYVTSLESSEPHYLVDSRWGAAYAPPGYLLFLSGGTLMAQRFDAGSRRLEGGPSPVAEGVGGATTDYGAFSVSDTGALAFAGTTNVPAQLTWFDRNGTRLDAVTPSGDYVTLRLSPDQRRVAFSRVDPEKNSPDIWVLDVARGATSRFTVDIGLDTHPVWSPDGSRIVFRSYRAGIGELYEKASSGGQSEQSIPTPGFDKLPTDWSRDGSIVVYGYQASNAASRFDIWTLPLNDRTPIPYLVTEFTEMHGRLSPDGRLIAFASDESGRFEIYVRTFPDPRGKWQISGSGGFEPVWRKDGRELFYIAADGKLMAVSVRTDRDFEAGAPVVLFETRVPVRSAPFRGNYDAADNGQRFLINTAIERATPPPISVVLDWTSTLKR